MTTLLATRTTPAQYLLADLCATIPVYIVPNPDSRKKFRSAKNICNTYVQVIHVYLLNISAVGRKSTEDRYTYFMLYNIIYYIVYSILRGTYIIIFTNSMYYFSEVDYLSYRYLLTPKIDIVLMHL